ncbi:MAG: hypothetical protein AAB365_00355 [Patescibacteria group bacterium]
MPPRRASRQSKSFTTKRRARTLLGVFGGIALVAGFLYIVSALSRVGPLTIETVRISGIDAESEQLALRASALGALEGSYLGIFSRANTLIYPKRTIVAKIKDQLASVERVSIDRDGAHTLNISIVEKEPAALVCVTLPDFNGTDLSLEDPGSCYFADGGGYIFKKAPSFTGNIYHRYYVPDLVSEASSTESVVGKSATSSDEFKALEKLYSTASANGIVSDAILIKANREYELYARNPPPVGAASSAASTVVIYFNTLTSLEEQTANLVSFWKHMVDQARAKRETLQFDSIDVRYGANVFYREGK